MKKLLLISLLAATGMAQAQTVLEDWARVKSSEPVYGQSVPTQRRVCNTVMVDRGATYPNTPPITSPQTNIGGAVVGGLLGGVIGSQFGKGEGSKALAAIGAGAGAVMGSRVDTTPNPAPGNQYGSSQMVPVEQCNIVNELQPAAIVGYRIVLDYNGRDIVYQSPYPPRSDSMRVRVNITPIQ